MEYALKLSQPEVIAVLNALGEVPLKTGFNAYARIVEQVREQDAANAIEVKP